MLPQNLPPSAVRKTSRVICNRYNVVKKIGNGTFGTVYLVEDVYKNKEKKVLKEICVGEMSEHESQGVDKEANLLSKLNHHNIVRMFESFMNEESFYIIMEYCEVGDLDRELKRWKTKGEIVPLQQVMDWFVQLIIAVQYIHSQKMLHRDLKCKNVFLTETKTVKIGDFGISRILTSTEYASTFTGTPYYMSPEVIKHDGYGSKSDIWSLGVILYEICELKRAFEGKNLMSVMMKIIQGNLPNISPERGGLADIFIKIMRSDPHERPSSSQLLTEPIIATHLSSLKQRLRGRRQSSASSTSSTKSTDSSRKMTARERMRLEKQKKADEEAEQLKHIAQENYAANRARTAARRENEINKPNIIQNSPIMGLAIKPLNPNIIRHDRDFCYSSRSSPGSRGISAIHPEPKKPIVKKMSSESDRQLLAIEKSLEFAAAEFLSQQIRERNNPSLVPKNNGNNSISDEVDGKEELDSDNKEIEENSSDSTLDNFVEHLEDASDLILTSTQENYKKQSITSLRNLSLGFSDDEITLSSSDEDVAELFETANEQCVLDIDSLELTAVSDIPEDPEEANTFYSFEEFEEDGQLSPNTPRTPRFSRDESIEYLVENHKDNQSFSAVRKSSSFEITTNKSVGADFNRSFPMDNFSNFDRFKTHEMTHEISQNDSECSKSSQDSSLLAERASTIILRSDRIKTLRSKCRDKLGGELFEKIYDYLNDARFGEEVEEEEVIVQALRDWAPQLTSQCFLVDQLIYLEKQEMLASKLI